MAAEAAGAYLREEILNLFIKIINVEMVTRCIQIITKEMTTKHSNNVQTLTNDENLTKSAAQRYAADGCGTLLESLLSAYETGRRVIPPLRL